MLLTTENDQLMFKRPANDTLIVRILYCRVLIDINKLTLRVVVSEMNLLFNDNLS